MLACIHCLGRYIGGEAASKFALTHIGPQPQYLTLAIRDRFSTIYQHPFSIQYQTIKVSLQCIHVVFY